MAGTTSKSYFTEMQICPVMEVWGRYNAVLVAAEYKTVETDEYGNTSTDTSTKLAMCSIVCAGVSEIKYVHNFCVGDYILCFFPSSVKKYHPYEELFKKFKGEYDPKGFGLALGTFYSEENPPPVKYPEVHQISFDGGYIRYNAEDKEITIKCTSDFTVLADNIRLN